MTQNNAPLAIPSSPRPGDVVSFGTDGWRAIIGEDFNTENLARLACAIAVVYDQEASKAGNLGSSDTAKSEANSDTISDKTSQTIRSSTFYIGYDCRENAGRYAAFAAQIIAGASGLSVIVSDSYCPTPALCWTVARDPDAIGGIMLTSSHNPAEYLGVKLRMADGGASPKQFSDSVEEIMRVQLPKTSATHGLPFNYEHALRVAQVAINATPDCRAVLGQTVTRDDQLFSYRDIVSPYIAALRKTVDAKSIAAAKLRVVVDPMYGAGRGFLARLLESLGVEVAEVNGSLDPSFGGLHPEPILPWIKSGLEKTVSLGFDACLITDGDADRIGAGDEYGNFVNPHRIITLLIAHLVENKGQSGRVVRTLSGSNLVKRQCQRLGLGLTTTPIGFKWVYGEMLAGDVLIGGEESGGIGIPSHVLERDGLLMALLLVELMAQTGKSLATLVGDLLHILGNLDYSRRDLRLSEDVKQRFVAGHCVAGTDVCDYRDIFLPLDEELCEVDHRDGIKLCFASDAWLLMRPSGTEPLVRVYAEAQDMAQVDALLDAGVAIVEGRLQ